MPKIDNPEDAARIAERVFNSWDGWRQRLTDWRNVIDRTADEALKAFAEILPPTLKDKWLPYQSADVQHEIQNLAYVLASNEVQIEIMSKSSDSGVLRLAQQLEEADEAILARLMPMNARVLRYSGIMGDGVCAQVLDIRAPGESLKGYADRKALKDYAEGDKEPDDLDISPAAKYRRAYKKRENDHERAYADVTKEAMLEDDIPVALRTLDALNFAVECDHEGTPQIFVERADIELSACLEILEGYGVGVEHGRIVATSGGKATDTGALTSESTPVEYPNWHIYGSTGEAKKVRYLQVRTKDEIYICVKGAPTDSAKDDGELVIRQPNPFAGASLGIYLTIATMKIRSSITQRMEPFVLPLIVETQITNAVVSALLAMAWAEASREEYEHAEDDGGIVPLDSTQETKNAQAASGQDTPPVSKGEIKRVPTTGVPLERFLDFINHERERYRTQELFSGSGHAGDSGRLLARMQTMALTKLAPIQTKCSETDKQILEDIHAWVAKAKRPIVVAQEPSPNKADRGDQVQIAPVRELTPKHATLPVFLSVTTGADTPEAKYAAQQVSREEMSAGTYGISYHRQIVGLKDPQRAEAVLIEDQLTQSFIEMATEKMAPVLDQKIAELVEALLPVLAPPAVPPGPPGAGSMPSIEGGDGMAGGAPSFVPPQAPAVPGQEGGIPDVAGLPPAVPV